MGVQTMSSHGDDGRRGLSRQGSVYSLTLTEVETQLGEPLRSMNLGDLLRTVLPAGPATQPAPAAKKTVDEVWRDIQSASGARQPTMGEMTLEDFLSRAGVTVDAGPHWLHQYPPPQQYVVPLGPGAGPAVDAVYRDGVGVGVGVFLSQVAGRKRGAAAAVGGDGVVERTVERRQKRMIKNRESAARSRARKQAYTNELENKVAQLEEENQRLRKLKMLPPLEPPPEHEQRPVHQPEHERRPVAQPEEAKQPLRRRNSATF
ncbi:ABSCISIC ACID-INSENSITIVE 5-like protein 3 isoform X1 [Panicum virgatum]|uniref:BZIP domain-containing protein n=1 Tax=Panicum virgatum TaxID=38727 RepID=A0A8T0VWC3_PANVG|nr:ABSCISIC ACID-INSENSITIVE 5-like protein 3 isoform X1 [Panicum virgatum]XP_039797326.1 ABSCISIC ACID-INSENSITIVE 5-like protein 3 isoform X1 [Panicum virgatum]KAG2639195.1 hypothetical protein PVAP13_2NG616300 [Panicum virgatum]KAG2639196.1 hypothetical protein PVAP13_2NG616300 [Panicum virgatum]